MAPTTKNHLKIFIILSSLVLAPLFLLITSIDDDNDNAIKTWADNQQLRRHLDYRKNSPLPSKVDENCENQGIFASWMTTPPIHKSVELEKIISDSYKDVERKIERLEFDADANIAIFTLISLCANQRENTCLPGVEKKFFKFNQIELLAKASELGSTEAKLLYALNAPSIAASVRRTRSSESEVYARNLMQQAERLGTEAAKEGNLDAARFMSISYENGRFGSRDIIKAYSFILPLHNSGTKEDKMRIEQFKATLTSDQISKAERFAFGCLPPTNFNNLANPFG